MSVGRMAVGVDVDGGRVWRVEARRKRGRPSFRAVEQGAGSAAVPVAAALPACAGFVRRLTAPLDSPAKALRVLPSLLDIELPFPLESCAHGFIDCAKAPGGGVEALALAARTEDVTAHLERLRAQGVDPLLLTHEAVALWGQAADEHPLAREQVRLVAYLGADRISLAAGTGRGLDAATGLRQGLRELFADAAPPAARQVIAQRLAPWWRAQQARLGGGGHVIWCGPGATDAQRVREVSALLFGGEPPKSVPVKEPEYLLPRGLAARLLAHPAGEGNLRSGALAHPGAERASRQRDARRLAALAASALLLAGLSAGWRVLLDHEKNRWQQRLVAEAATLAGTDRLPPGQERLAAQRAMDEQAAGWAAFRQSLEPGADATLARVLASAGRPGLSLQVLTLRPASLLIHGAAMEWSDGEYLERALTADGWRVKLERRDAGADERVHFTLQGER
jgi:hypothetical protein